MTVIYSKDNPRFKQTLRVAQGKKTQPPKVWLEGVHLCQSWLQSQQPIDYLVIDEHRLATDIELQQLYQQVESTQCLILSTALMRQLSQVEQNQGVALVVSAPQAPELHAIQRSALYLDRIQDPGNVGTLLRTAAAAGIQQVYLSPGCAWAWSQKVLRSAQGAHFALIIHEQIQVEQLLHHLHIPLYTTALEQAQSLYSCVLAPEAVWAFGNEGQGVAPELLTYADQRVYIPQAPLVESLNVAVAAGVCLFEHRRQQLLRT